MGPEYVTFWLWLQRLQIFDIHLRMVWYGMVSEPFCMKDQPCKVVIDLCACVKCGITWSRDPCHLQDAPGQGQEYGLYSQVSSCSLFSVWSKVTEHPTPLYLQGNITVLATFSIARFLMDPKGPLHVGQHCNFGRHVLHTRWPL